MFQGLVCSGCTINLGGVNLSVLRIVQGSFMSLENSVQDYF